MKIAYTLVLATKGCQILRAIGDRHAEPLVINHSKRPCTFLWEKDAMNAATHAARADVAAATRLGFTATVATTEDTIVVNYEVVS